MRSRKISLWQHSSKIDFPPENNYSIIQRMFSVFRPLRLKNTSICLTERSSHYFSSEKFGLHCCNKLLRVTPNGLTNNRSFVFYIYSPIDSSVDRRSIRDAVIAHQSYLEIETILRWIEWYVVCVCVIDFTHACWCAHTLTKHNQTFDARSIQSAYVRLINRIKNDKYIKQCNHLIANCASAPQQHECIWLRQNQYWRKQKERHERARGRKRTLTQREWQICRITVRLFLSARRRINWFLFSIDLSVNSAFELIDRHRIIACHSSDSLHCRSFM